MRIVVHRWQCLSCGMFAAAAFGSEYWRPSICPDCKTAFGAVLIYDPVEVDPENFDLSAGLPILTKEAST